MTTSPAEMDAHPLLHSVTVIVVTFNSAHCLPGLRRFLFACPHIFFVDNASDDRCAELIPEYFPQAKVLALSENVGFGAANNRALHQIATPFALLLNPDCEITPESIEKLVQTAQLWPDAAMVAPQLYTPLGQPEVNYRWPHFFWKSRGPGAISGPACVGFLCGAAMLLRMEVYKNRFFDERFFLYYENNDLCTRLFQNKQAMIVDPSSQATHRSRGSVRGQHPLKSEYLRGYHHAQSKLTYVQKYSGTPKASKLKFFLFIKTSMAIPLRLIFFNARLLFRMWGRLQGIRNWSK